MLSLPKLVSTHCVNAINLGERGHLAQRLFLTFFVVGCFLLFFSEVRWLVRVVVFFLLHNATWSPLDKFWHFILGSRGSRDLASRVSGDELRQWVDMLLGSHDVVDETRAGCLVWMWLWCSRVHTCLKTSLNSIVSGSNRQNRRWPTQVLLSKNVFKVVIWNSTVSRFHSRFASCPSEEWKPPCCFILLFYNMCVGSVQHCLDEICAWCFLSWVSLWQFRVGLACVVKVPVEKRVIVFLHLWTEKIYNNYSNQYLPKLTCAINPDHFHLVGICRENSADFFLMTFFNRMETPTVDKFNTDDG